MKRLHLGQFREEEKRLEVKEGFSRRQLFWCPEHRCFQVQESVEAGKEDMVGCSELEIIQALRNAPNAPSKSVPSTGILLQNYCGVCHP